ncbi:hypothetical protein HWQ46_09750 [Shewanella sp. D64]|uniref:hypothetical protein n=1 Tax=unclassified Shewanella TaxID=196818 RepID=UPI0022BA3BFA|nr:MULTISPECIES: hypothetical protein [unclassified Shewanella]MEC4725826.1 hypothetical protein [Shewanella sp. D64]MEC4737567.1 hypothetical protein [Shewanella sp. E94]WBJ93385.1 hypothetical protein HWQ47_15735 [Shewanella sp. MTB7]
MSNYANFNEDTSKDGIKDSFFLQLGDEYGNRKIYLTYDGNTDTLTLSAKKIQIFTDELSVDKHNKAPKPSEPE